MHRITINTLADPKKRQVCPCPGGVCGCAIMMAPQMFTFGCHPSSKIVQPLPNPLTSFNINARFHSKCDAIHREVHPKKSHPVKKLRDTKDN